MARALVPRTFAELSGSGEIMAERQGARRVEKRSRGIAIGRSRQS